jgi:hypothetical protein
MSTLAELRRNAIAAGCMLAVVMLGATIVMMVLK